MTTRSLSRPCLAAAAACALALAAAVPPGLATAQTVTTGPFRDLAGLDAALQRGVATKADVRRTFGIPNGGGAARFFSFGGDERELWYYEDIEATGVTSADGVMKFRMRQQMLIVMFKSDRVDGYLWTSNRDTAEAK
jgi:hypothetical protein